jgi:hypothetical protein
MAPYTVNPTVSAKLLDSTSSGYSTCLTTRCWLHVQRVTSPTLDCNSIAPGDGHPCRAWSTDPNLNTKYECRYGTYVLPMNACASLTNAYTASPTITPNTGTGAGTVTAPDPDADPSAGMTPGLDNGCVPSGLGILNPFWLLKGVGCAIKWAFVPPSGSFETAVGTMRSGWSDNGLTEWGGAVGGVGGSLGELGSGTSGCAGPHFEIPLGGNSYDFDPLDACAQPMQGVAVVIKLLATVGLIVAGVKLCARPLLSAFGMGGAV